MGEFEQKITNAVNEKLNDGTIENLISQYIEKGVSKALEDTFSWNGAGKKLIQEKIDAVVVPMIERHDFNNYLVKLDSVLAEIINKTNLAENKEILSKFEMLMLDPEKKSIKLSEIFKKWKENVARNVNTDNLEAMSDGGSPYYEWVTAKVEVVYERSFLSSNNHCVVNFSCDKDEDLKFQIRLYRYGESEEWSLYSLAEDINILSLCNMSEFELFINKLKRAFCKIELDIEKAEEEVEPEETPEWSLS